MVKSSMIRRFAILALLAGLSTATAGAAELTVTSAVGFRPALQELAQAFEKSSGHKLKIEYATAGKVDEKVRGEDTIDVAIVTKSLFDKQVREAKMVGGTTTQLARQQNGLAVKKGAAKPGGAASIFVAQQFEKLGITGEIKPKLKLLKAAAGQAIPPVADAVQRGEAEIGILPLSLAMQVQGIDVVGPLPAEFQSPDLAFVAGTPWTCERPIEAKALIDFLAGPAAKAVYKAKGMEPG
ncbi:MAG: ABC transporter substrate-binding protein [Alphaproteobacteria bacterium]|nr:MAG: ABC transporter substrate-binding protein [Alphaproteobacteria bacterium]